MCEFHDKNVRVYFFISATASPGWRWGSIWHSDLNLKLSELFIHKQLNRRHVPFSSKSLRQACFAPPASF
jgi:hypothetical protein